MDPRVITCNLAPALPHVTPPSAWPSYISAKYEPEPDITAYELALIVPLFSQGLTEERWAALGAAQRHLKRIA